MNTNTTLNRGAADLPEALRRSTAADGKTELFNLPGYPLMVRAVDFNRIHTESEMRRTALLDEMQKDALAAGQATAGQQGAAYAALPDEREMLKHALWLASSFTVHRYLMSNAEGRWSGAEKATCHDELCCLYVAVFRGVEVDRVRVDLDADWVAVHDATQELTDHLDVVIGFPLKGVPDYESLAPKFFAYFHRLAAHALRASHGQAPAQEAPATKPAPQQPRPACAALARTVMLDQVSFGRKPDCYGIRQITDDEGVEEWEDIRTSPDVAREEANDMMATGRGEIYEVVPLWTTPQPSPTAQSADSVPAVSDLPPLPAPDLRDVGTKPQEIKEFLKGYATEYARTAIAARDPADSVQEDAARYRFLRDGEWRGTDLEPFIRLQLNTLWDAKIDAARAAQEGGK